MRFCAPSSRSGLPRAILPVRSATLCSWLRSIRSCPLRSTSRNKLQETNMTDKVQFQGITVAELIEALKREDPEAQVGFAYPYGDYWDSKVVQSVRKVRVNE